MKRTPPITLYDLSLGELHSRADRACRLLRDAQAAAAHPPSKRDRASDLRAMGDAIDATERLLPGLMEQPRALLARTLLALAPQERRTLRQVIDAERAARERLARWLGGVPLVEAEEALARIEAHESVSSELSALWRLLGATYAPLLA